MHLMYPTLFSIGSLHVYSASVAIVFAWLVFSFLFWRAMRAHGIHEDSIFDLTFYATLVGFAVARIGFIVLHWEIFSGKSLLLMLALWVAPGLTWLGALVGGLATMVYLCRERKIRLGLVLDALPMSLGLPIILGKFGSLLGGAEIGTLSRVPWAVHYAGYTGTRAPVQIYEMFAMVVLMFVSIRLAKTAQIHKWAYGIVGIWYFGLYSIIMFGLEFFKVSRVYWGNITANQWMFVGIFAESIGVLYVRGGGREHIRPFFRSLWAIISQRIKKIYAKISCRHADTDPKASSG